MPKRARNARFVRFLAFSRSDFYTPLARKRRFRFRGARNARFEHFSCFEMLETRVLSAFFLHRKARKGHFERFFSIHALGACFSFCVALFQPGNTCDSEATSAEGWEGLSRLGERARVWVQGPATTTQDQKRALNRGWPPVSVQGARFMQFEVGWGRLIKIDEDCLKKRDGDRGTILLLEKMVKERPQKHRGNLLFCLFVSLSLQCLHERISICSIFLGHVPQKRCLKQGKCSACSIRSSLRRNMFNMDYFPKLNMSLVFGHFLFFFGNIGNEDWMSWAFPLF